jgi:hypothetical protein
MSILTGRYSGSPETTFDLDIRQIEPRACRLRRRGDRERAAGHLLDRHAAAAHGHIVRPRSPYFIAYQAAQARLGDKGFLSTDITVRDLLLNRGDKHHVFPRKHLKDTRA